MSSAEQIATKSETVRKHKEFLFPAVANYYQEPIALVRGEGLVGWCASCLFCQKRESTICLPEPD
jgi:hypothetical protein